MPSPHFRRILWYSAWVVWLPVTAYGISAGNLLLTFVIGTPLFLASLYFSLQVLSAAELTRLWRKHAPAWLPMARSRCGTVAADQADDWVQAEHASSLR